MSPIDAARGYDHGGAVLDTYRGLRLATVVVVVLLGAAVLAQAIPAGCWQTSISAYYWTAAHAVFIAALCVIGTCLIVYKGSSDLEDAALSFSGFLAFVVAFVPTAREPLCGGPGLPADVVVGPGIRNTVGALLIAGVVGEIASLLARRSRRHAVDPEHPEPARPFLAWSTLRPAALAVGAVVYLALPGQLETRGHDVAAVTMFVGIIVVVVANARSSRRAGRPERYVRAYGAVAVSMALTLVGIVALHVSVPTWEHAIIVVEALLIVEFAIFWLVQTVELWNLPDRRALIAARLAAGSGAPGTQ